MTYLQLCQRLRQECGIPGTGPSTVTGQTGEMARLVSWVSQSWLEIQEMRPDWEWMRKTFSFDTVAGQQEYDAATDVLLTDFGMWRNDSFRLYLKSAGAGNETFLSHCDYANFRDYYIFGSRRTAQARPTVIAVTPSKDLALGLVPNDVYTVNGEYFTTPVTLSADSDTPVMPSRYHMMIVYRGMQKYGLYESAQEQIAMGKALESEMMNKLIYDQAPSLAFGSSLI